MIFGFTVWILRHFELAGFQLIDALWINLVGLITAFGFAIFLTAVFRQVWSTITEPE
jgi:hypothetical protein